MRLAAEERIHDEPAPVGGGATRLGGTDIFRGVLVIVTALIIGGFVISRGLDTGSDAADDDAAVADTDTDTDTDTGALGSDQAGEADGEGADGQVGSEATASTIVDDQAPAPDPSAPGTASDDAAAPADGAADGSTGGTEVLPQDTTPEAPALRPPAEVKVLVLNAAQTQGIAARGTEALLAQNYLTGTPKNADTSRASVILFAESYEPEALEVAAVFGPGLEGLVQPLDPNDLPIADTQQANVIVVIGPDDLIPIS